MKKLTFIIIGFAFILIAGVFWITNSTHKPEQNNTQTATPKKISPANLKTISAKTKKTLSSLANSGADKASLSELNQLIKELNNYSTEKNESSDYIKNLQACLEAVKSYSTGKADEKALGKVYPNFLLSEQKLTEIEKTNQYDWFYAAAATNEQGLKENGVVTLTMVGDNSFGTYPETPENLKFDNVFKKNNGTNTYVFKNCLPWFKSDDFTVINAESAFTNATKAENKKWRIKSDPAHVAFLPASGVDAANL
ncbi:TPA: CapA family protein, partial [Listeria innocua]